MNENDISGLTDKLEDIWIRAHGYEKVSATMLECKGRLVAIMFEHALTPTEIHLANEPKSRSLITEYAEQLIRVIKPDIVAAIDGLFDCSIIGSSITLNPIDGSFFCLFQCERELPERPRQC